MKSPPPAKHGPSGQHLTWHAQSEAISKRNCSYRSQGDHLKKEMCRKEVVRFLPNTSGIRTLAFCFALANLVLVRSYGISFSNAVTFITMLQLSIPFSAHLHEHCVPPVLAANLYIYIYIYLYLHIEHMIWSKRVN